MALETTSGNQCSELFSSTMIPQMTVVVDLTRGERSLSLKPGYAVEDCHACGLPRWRFRTARAQRGHSANYYSDYPGNNPENHPPCGIMHNQFKTQKFKHLMLAMGPRDLNSAPYSPVHCSSHSMTSFQSSELTELPVVENSQLFAQRVHSARYAPPVCVRHKDCRLENDSGV